MATEVKIPAVGESVTEVTLVEWLKANGDSVEKDESLCLMETDKADFELPSPAAGVVKHLHKEGETIAVGEIVAEIDESGAAEPAAGQTQTAEPAKDAGETQELSPAVRRLIEEHNLDPSKIYGSGRGGRLTKEDVLAYLETKQAKHDKQPEPEVTRDDSEPPAEHGLEESAHAPAPRTQPPEPKSITSAQQMIQYPEDGVKRVPMSKIRRRIAERLVKAQRTTASLTTFNEIDMSAVLALREKYKERFDEVHGVSLGLMSFFVRACTLALKEFPRVNAGIEGDDIIYHQHVHLGIAVSTERGLVVPVLRDAETLSFADIEFEIKRMAKAARAGKLNIQELSGGTFTITNGGIYGSMLSTPILNPPQSAILGMHAIEKRPVARGEQVAISPMMYVALTYDHRLVDGKESVSFLVKIKQLIEDPSRMMLEI
ncbi:MAG: 2-oxoglutarate dehydrogenase complex dihydrolipoyllysine-residue succinyltransferase [bacterium]|nr:2-oxoglutarate dehydrogenase complex dihydrolipoyllysine-residue succinyltransferase [bacterium]